MATDLATAADLLYTRLTTQLPLVEPDVRIAVRNGPPLKPLPNPRSDAWVLAHVLDGASIPLNIYPADRGFHLGRLEVQIFTPLGASDGDARSREIATEIDTIFRATDVDGVRCGIPEYIPQGAREDVGFWQDNLSVPFHYQSVRP